MPNTRLAEKASNFADPTSPTTEIMEATTSANNAEQDAPAPKKAKRNKSRRRAENDEIDSWGIGQNRFIRLSKFRGEWFVNIRDYYRDQQDKMRPARTGLLMPLSQWKSLKTVMADVDRAIRRIK